MTQNLDAISLVSTCTASECADIYNNKEGDMRCENWMCISNFPTTTGTISSDGGAVSLPGVVDVDFSNGTFAADSLVKLSKQLTDSLEEAFTNLTEVFRAYAPSTHKVHIEVDNKVSSGKNVIVSIPVPETGTPEDQAEVFVLMPNSSPEEGPYPIFALFESDHGNKPDMISFELPDYAFSPTHDGKYEAIFLVAPTPGPSSTSGGDLTVCQGASIRCPLEQGCEVSSPYGLWTDPNTNEARIHYGVDYKADENTPVLAAADGNIQTSATYDGYGRFIILRHADGSATLYGHLSSSIVERGSTVLAGQQIGYVGSSGISSNAHLHFEYAPNGVLVQTKRRIDPHPCVGTYTSGSIAVGDNGWESDDVFKISVDGIVIGSTFKGKKIILA
jgi:murein DD-endopeptidase MepM/ murein hydrolase activator NlpD